MYSTKEKEITETDKKALHYFFMHPFVHLIYSSHKALRGPLQDIFARFVLSKLQPSL